MRLDVQSVVGLALCVWFALGPPATADPRSATGCSTLERRAEPELSVRIDAIVDRAVTEGFAGGVALILDGSLVYERVAGFSDRRGRVPVTADTLFHVASISKYFTAVAVLKAAEEERLRLDGSIGELVSAPKLAARGVTVEDLLAHRSGLGSSYAAESETASAEAAAVIDSQPVDAGKAGGFRYSNDGYDLLAVVLERVYDRRFEDVVRDLVLAPACLERARFWAEVDLTDPTEVGQPLNSVAKRLRRRNYGMLGSAGLLITAADLVAFQQTLSSGSVLAQSSLDRLTAPHGEVSIGRATLGAFLVDHPKLGRALSARGYEDWGDNAILNHYLDRGAILAVVTSKGPPERSDRPPFRSSLSAAIEEILAD